MLQLLYVPSTDWWNRGVGRWDLDLRGPRLHGTTSRHELVLKRSLHSNCYRSRGHPHFLSGMPRCCQRDQVHASHSNRIDFCKLLCWHLMLLNFAS